MSKTTIKDASGNPQEVELTAGVYQEAIRRGLTVPQLLNSTYPTNVEKFGTPFEQMMAAEGMFMHADHSYGIRPPSLAEIIEGRAAMNAGTIVRDASPTSRILFPAVFLEAVENKLRVDNGSIVAAFDKLIAIDDSIAGARFEQPIINYTQAEKSRHQGIAQNALPPNMMTITTSDVARKIPTFSLGLEITKEAMQASTLDLVALALSRQAEVERASRINDYWTALLNGDVDNGTAGLTAVTSTSLDSNATGGVLTHKAWIKFLRTNWNRRHIDWVICDLDTAFKIESRTGKPTFNTDDPRSPRIDALFNLANPQWQDVRLLLVDDGTIPANTIIGIDSRYAIRRVRNNQAEYAAVEEFVLKKSEAMRYDFGEIVYRLFDEAWAVMTIS
jgi:hypothetical protein